VGEAADVIALLTDVENYSTLVGIYSWTFDRAEAWITETLCATLLQARQKSRFIQRTRTQRRKPKS